MADIIERLRIESRREPHEPIWRDAIDEIEALRAESDALREALIMTTKHDGGPIALANHKTVTFDEAEALAINAVRQYLSDCKLTKHDQIGNHLMKLCGVAALFIWSREGPEIAALRLEGAAEFIRQRMAMKGSVAQHFDEAIDHARRAEGGNSSDARTLSAPSFLRSKNDN